MRNNKFRVVISALLITISFQTVFAQSAQNAETEKVRRSLVKILQGDNNQVKVKLKSGERMQGNLTAVEVYTFTVYDKNTNAPIAISFRDLQSVKKASSLKGKYAWWIAGLGVMVLAIARGGN